MKRLLVLNYEFPPLGGGASPVSYELARRLSETGYFDIDVVTMGFQGLPLDEEVNSHFRIHRIKCWRSKKEICHPWEQLTYLVSGYFKCRQLLKANHFDICHAHFIIPTGVLALKLKKKFGLPYVITAHGSDVLGYGPRFKYLYPLLAGKWRQILDNAKTVISPSNFLKKEILKVYPEYDESKVVVIPNGIDTEKFKPQTKKNYILSTGKLVPNKGFQYLIEAVSDKDIGWEVHVAGDGPMMKDLKNMASKSKTKIIFHGRLDGNSQKYKNLLAQASIYVLASERENASISLLEAMASECMIIAANNPGSAETVGDSGVLFAPHNVAELKAALTITNEPVKVESWGHAARERAENTYAYGRIVKEYIRTLA